MANLTDKNKIDDKSTTFSGESLQLNRIRSALTTHTNLIEWDVDYVAMQKYFGDTLRFYDFSLPCEGWYGYFSLNTESIKLSYSTDHQSEYVIEELNIQSSYDLKIYKKYWKKLNTHLRKLNDEIPYIYLSHFSQSTESGVITLETSFVKPATVISDQELFYFLTIHKLLSHQFFPSINQIIENKVGENNSAKTEV